MLNDSGNTTHDLDDPALTEGRRSLIRNHAYLSALYVHWYELLKGQLPEVDGEVLELGSGGGFFEELLPGLVTSDVMPVEGVSQVIDATSLPFDDGSLSGIVGTNVLHHVRGIELFLGEASRVLVEGGRLVFIEPWPTLWSLPVYKFLHHEPFDRSRDWSIPEGGPLTAANGALPWILFSRDADVVERQFPGLSVVKTAPLMPVSYLACGGLDRAFKFPGILFSVLRLLEKPFDRLGMFALVVIEKKT